MNSSEYLPRTIENEITNLRQRFKAVLVSGMRQVGKTTVLSKIANSSQVQMLNLDDTDVFNLASGNAAAFFSLYPLPLFIDEIQRVPQLFNQLKAEIDKQEKYGQVFLSGSQRFALMKGVGDSLAGRIFELHLMPLSIYERVGLGLKQQPYVPQVIPVSNLGDHGADDIWQIIQQGAFPGVIKASDHERQQFYEAFIRTFLERDLRDFSNLVNLNTFRKFLTALCLRTGQELRLNTLQELTGVSAPTIKRWLDIAESAGFIYLLKPYSSNQNKTLSKSPKLYVTDTGIISYMCGYQTIEELKASSSAGAIFETFVVTEILKSYRHNGLEPQLFFYRDAKKQSEIDLLIHTGGIWYPIEIKASRTPDNSMIRHFKELDKYDIKQGQGAVICNTGETRYLANAIVAHSIWRI